jgi:F0F1-type ATP synthase epsilon subunit
MKLAGEPHLYVRVLSPTKTLAEGMAYAVSAVNEAGPFDILANHAHFFSLLTEGEIRIMGTSNPDEALRIPVNKGLIKVADNQVTLFVDIEPAPVKNQPD